MAEAVYGDITSSDDSCGDLLEQFQKETAETEKLQLNIHSVDQTIRELASKKKILRIH